MAFLSVTAYQIAERFLGIKEVEGTVNNPQILSMLRLDADWPQEDEVPWCSAFANYICWLLRLPRSKSLRAKSWLEIGTPVRLDEAQQGFDIVILNRGTDPAQGHVGFYSSHNLSYGEGRRVYVLGGNQSNKVSVAGYNLDDVVGVRRLYV